MDEEIFQSAIIQRSYQYLRRFSELQNLASFSYKPGSIEGNVSDVLRLLLQ